MGATERLSGLRTNVRGNAGLLAVLLLLGVGLIIVAIIFAATHGSTWPTYTGFGILGVGVLASAGVAYGSKALLLVVLAGVLDFIGLLILILHYLGVF